MSHTIDLDSTEKQLVDRPTIRSKEALEAACAALGLDAPKWVENHRVGDGPLATGWAVQLKDKDGVLTKWNKLTVYNLEEGKEYADNWPVYGPNHIEVRKTNEWITKWNEDHPTERLTWPEICEKMRAEGLTPRRCYEGGRWGAEELLWRLDAEYIKAAHEIIMQTYRDTAKQKGSSLRVLEQTDTKIKLRIDHGAATVGGSDNPLDAPTELK